MFCDAFCNQVCHCYWLHACGPNQGVGEMESATQIRKRPSQYDKCTIKIALFHFYYSGMFQDDQLFVLFISPHGGTDLEHFEVYK